MKTWTLLLVASAFTTSIDAPLASDSSNNAAEILYGVNLYHHALITRVMSHGCTHDEDFELQKKATDMGYEVQVVRIKKDRCRKMGEVIQVSIPLDPELKNAQLMVRNPLRHIGQ